MSGALRRMSDDEVGSALASRIDWPETPAITPEVLARIGDVDRAPGRARPRLSLPSRRRTVLILVFVVLGLAAAVAAAKFAIDFGAVQIRVAPTPPLLPSRSTPPGHPTTLSEAEAAAGFEAVMPPGLSQPDRVWADTGSPDAARIVLAWQASPDLPAIDHLPWGAVLYEFRGDAGIAVKTLASATQLRTTHVQGRVAYFVTGQHELDLLTDAGTYARYRVAGNVLIWQEGGITLRLESRLPLRAALRLAGR